MSMIKGINDEITRVEELKKLYQGIGGAGMFGVMTINQAVENGKKSIESGDVVKMTLAYKNNHYLQMYLPTNFLFLYNSYH